MNTIDMDATREFKMLVEEMRPLGFRTSAEVSKYIIKNRLGLKYRTISGHLQMQNGSDDWTFEGGISPVYYRQLCQALGLFNNRSDASVIGFTPFRDLPFDVF